MHGNIGLFKEPAPSVELAVVGRITETEPEFVNV
jgi:hypothetical protein